MLPLISASISIFFTPRAAQRGKSPRQRNAGPRTTHGRQQSVAQGRAFGRRRRRGRERSESGDLRVLRRQVGCASLLLRQLVVLLRGIAIRLGLLRLLRLLVLLRSLALQLRHHLVQVLHLRRLLVCGGGEQRLQLVGGTGPRRRSRRGSRHQRAPRLRHVGKRLRRARRVSGRRGGSSATGRALGFSRGRALRPTQEALPTLRTQSCRVPGSCGT